MTRVYRVTQNDLNDLNDPIVAAVMTSCGGRLRTPGNLTPLILGGCRRD